MARQQSLVAEHPDLLEIERLLIGGRTSLDRIARLYFTKEMDNGVSIEAVRMRLARYKKTHIGKRVKQAETMRNKRKVDQLLDCAQDLAAETAELRRVAVAEKQWGAVGELSGHAREDLKFVGELVGVNPREQEGQTPHVMFQQLIAMPHQGPMYAPPPGQVIEAGQDSEQDDEALDVDGEGWDDEDEE